MRYRKLTPTGDYSAGRGQSDWLSNTPATVAQAVQTRLRLYSGDWFLNVQDGTPWRTSVLGRNAEVAADLALRQRVFGTTGLTGITSFASTLNRDTRRYNLTMTVTTVYDNGATATQVTV